MVVLKFGGTSVQNAAMMDRTLDITEKEIGRAPVLVASAMSKVTDGLLKLIEHAVNAAADAAFAELEALAERHRTVAKEMLSGANLSAALGRLEGMFKELSSLCRGLVLLKECSGRTSDAFVATGELLSTTLLYFRALERGIKADWLDARGFVRTDDRFTSAAPDMAETRRLTREKVQPEAGRIIITQGFIGSTAEGVTTTLGRGGSDYSATILGSCLGAEEVQIWTDVNGIMTTDPRVIPSARSIPEISYNEAAELAYFGAKVVHPSTIQPAIDLNIPVWVKNTMDPREPGTVILPDARGAGLRAIAAKKGITLINVVSSRMLNAYGFLNRMFAVFDKHRTPVDLIATSEVSVSMSVENAQAVEQIVHELRDFASVEVKANRSIICLVGKNLWGDTGFFVRVFSALKDIPVHLISLGASNINLSLVVPREETENAVSRLHAEFFKD